MKARVSYLFVPFCLIFGCPGPTFTDLPVESICVKNADSFLPKLESKDLQKTKVLIVSSKFRTTAVGFIDAFLAGLEQKGWHVLDADAVAKTRDPVFDIQAALNQNKPPDIVAFYIARQALFDQWSDLQSATFTKLLIAEDIHFYSDIVPTQHFISFGDAVFARYPEAFTAVIAPQKIACFPLYHAASEEFYTRPDTDFSNRKNRLLLSGAIDPKFYPLRSATLSMKERAPNLVDHRKHPGYAADKNPLLERLNYADAIASYSLAMAGTAPFPAVAAPYIVAKHFEIPATETVMVTDKFLVPYLAPLGFEENIHFLATTPADLEADVVNWLKPENAQMIKVIAKNGRELVLKNHTLNHRVEQFDSQALRFHKLVTER